MELKTSRLNPLANSFVPSRRNGNNPIKEIAEKYVKEIVRRKEAKGEKSLTKFEMAELVGYLISLKFKIRTNNEVRMVKNYISDKIIRADVPTLILNSTSKSNKPPFKTKFIMQDFSKYQPPRTTFLITAFWGLYRLEQAEMPLLSLTYRPEIVRDDVWSVQSSDIKLWNSCVVDKTCSCPPMFGYTVPPTLFGNVFNQRYCCEEQYIHLNHYAEKLNGNEYILSTDFKFSTVEEYHFIDDIEEQVVKYDLDVLRNHYKTIVIGLHEILMKLEETSESSEKSEERENFEDLNFWDTDSSLTYKPMLSGKDLIDDGEHPLLELEDFVENKDISTEIEEMIRSCLSTNESTNSRMPNSAIEHFNAKPVENEELVCDPPCSVWCNSKRTIENSEISVNVESTVTSDFSTEKALEIDLVSPAQLNSQTKTKEKFSFADLKPVLDLAGPKIPRPFYKRSFSVNDCDPSYYDKKFGVEGSAEQVVNPMSSKDMLMFLRRDPVNFFKTFNRSDSWKDTDSGFSSDWSSHEEIYQEKVQEDKGSMWGLFSGDDSLWKPLPECATPPETSDKNVTHKRVRDLKRQRSVT